MAFLRPIVQALQGLGHAYADMTPASRERKQQEMGLAEYIANHPEAYDEIAPLGKNLRIDLSKYAPSDDRRLEGVSAKIQKDPYTMTPNQIALDAKQAGVDTSPIGGQTARFAGSDTDEGLLPSTQYGPTNRPSIQTLMQQRQDQVAAQDADTQRKIAAAGQQASAQAHGQATGHAQGVHEAAPTALADLVTQRNTIDPMDVTKAGNVEGAQFDATHNPVRQQSAINLARGIANAQAGAVASYRNPDILYDTSGGAHAYKFDQSGAHEVSGLPPDLGKQPTKLLAGQVDQVSAINRAEVEGVKILAELKKAGLDQSNDPLDPRWQKFLAGKLGIESGDFAKADIQQRTAFVNALLTRGLMGNRPSQYVAQIIQQHLPQGEQTGEKLYHVLNNVLQQGGEGRTEIANLTRNKIPGPASGMSYQQWLELEKTMPSVLSPAQSTADKLRQMGVQ